MSAFYDEMAQLAEELLEEFGRTITLKRTTPAAHNPVIGRVTPGTPTSQQLKAAILPASQGTIQAFDVRFFSGIEASMNIRFGILSTIGHTFVPAPGDTAEFDGTTWNVLGCTPLNVDGTPVTFNVGFMER